jgi:hypothetical protein
MIARLRPALAACLVAGALGPASAQAAENPISLENARPASKFLGFDTAPATEIEGYLSRVSVRAGSAVDLHVNAPASRYRIEIYRFGWYQSPDGRMRLKRCVPSCRGSRAPSPQPARPAPDPTTGSVDAGWSVTNRLRIGRRWRTGYYDARFVLTSGPDKGKSRDYPFVVTPSAGARRSEILVVAPVTTWQAYNNWGGKSLYADSSTGRVAASHLSFNRPRGPSLFLAYEYQVVRFLERLGYDVSYVTDVDVDRDPSLLEGHRTIVGNGHGEYWTMRMREAWEAARDRGQNLVFLGSDTATWQVRYEDDHRTLVGYKSRRDPVADPQLETIRFRDLPQPRPECQLLGVQRDQGKRNATDPPRDYVVTDAALTHPWFRGTGLEPGDVLANLVGHEWDVYNPACRAATVLLHYEGTPSNSDAVAYTAPSGARVFSTGSLHFNWALDGWGGHRLPEDPRVGRLVQNALDDMAPDSRPRDARRGAPRLSNVTLGSSVLRPRRKIAVRFRLSEASRVVFRVARAAAGPAHGPSVAAWVRAKPRGPGAFRFGRSRLRPGRYELVVTAVDAPNNASASHVGEFRVSRR